ncbi:hypothetical protein [Paenibacillus odorifer]|uniref:hypothetical protein n=1 Tax=Paenibacillus odorifer TaxID=189426 RepID=UPI00117E9615|nr:hypothetical protein [Paenibacillus odorifer]
MRNRKLSILTSVLCASFIVYTVYTFKKYNNADFSSLTDALTVSMKGINDLVTRLMPDFSNMSW